MNYLQSSTYFTVTGVIFAVIAVLQAYRAFANLPANIGDFAVPVWLSWIAFVVAAYLAWSAYQNSNH